MQHPQGAEQAKRRDHQRGGGAPGRTLPRVHHGGDVLESPKGLACQGQGDRDGPDLVAERARGRLPAARDDHRHDEGVDDLPAIQQDRAQRPGDGGQQDVVDGPAVGPGRGADGLEVDLHHGEPPLRTGRPVQRRSRCREGSTGAELAESVTEATQDRPEPRHGAQPGRGRVDRQPQARRRRLRLTAKRDGCAVDQVGENPEPAHPVGKHVVEDQDHGGASASQPRDVGERPPRPVGGQRRRRHPGGEVQQRTLVAGGGARHDPDMAAHVEAGVVDPDGPPTPDRGPPEPLPQPGHGAEAFVQRVREPGRVEGAGGLQHQDGARMPSGGALLDGELHEVAGAGPFDLDARRGGDHREGRPRRRPAAVHATHRDAPSGAGGAGRSTRSLMPLSMRWVITKETRATGSITSGAHRRRCR
jgi:hypothetical protein